MTSDNPTGDLPDEIAKLEHHIKVRKGALPYIDRGYFEERDNIRELENKLHAMKLRRDHAAG